MMNTNVENKMTIAQKYDALIEICSEMEINLDGFDVIEFLEDRKAKSVKKASSKANEKKVAENKALADLIAKAIDEIGRPARVGEIATSATILGAEQSVSSSKITSILTKTNADMFIKSVEKGVSYYSVA